MRPPSPSPPPVDADYANRLLSIGRDAGLEAAGIGSADVLTRARAELLRRRSLGLHDGMAFTYRNPIRSTDPSRTVAEPRAILVGALSYWAPEPPKPAGPHGRIARYAWSDHYGVLRAALRTVARQLKADGHRAVVLVDDNSIVDREVAYRAGLGWFGKNANLLLNGAGSWFVLGSVVTTADLPASVTSPQPDGCGRCTRCIPACPTGAIVADGVIDAGRCLSWILQRPGDIAEPLRTAIGDRLYGCDDCQTACPPTIRWGQTQRTSTGPDPRAWVDVVALLEATDDEVVRLWGRWYLADRDARWARRNALIVIGNTADAQDKRARRAVERHLAHEDPVVSEMARWALLRLDDRTIAVRSPSERPDPSRRRP